MDVSKYAELFLTEGREQVSEMHTALRTLEDSGRDASDVAAAIAAMFRAAHNIKSMAATMEYTVVTELAHALETRLDSVRTGEERLTPSLVIQLFDETDALARAIEAVDAGIQTKSEQAVPLASAPDATTPTAVTSGLAQSWSREMRSRYIRVETSRLDVLMTLAGELEIARGRLERVARESGEDSIDVAVTQVSRLISELREQIVTARMVPVGQVFERLPRMVRETARVLGKDVEFVIEGKDIELDRSMLDEIGDPVVHLLRNAIDHGIEGPQEREQCGKPARARLTLSTHRESDHVLIHVTDDGRGVDRGRVLRKAHATGSGIVDASTSWLSDVQLLAILTRPGFSTADRITDISGRGVGLDVVNATVRSLGGSLDIHSVWQQGTTVTMQLPLTIAIIRAILARLGDETFVIPVTHVLETIELDPRAIQMEEVGEGRAGTARPVVSIRNEHFPVVQLREMVGLPPYDTALPKAVTLNVHGRRAALVVDNFIGQQDVVVKQFDAVYGMPQLFGGATILSDGAPALIVDVNSVV
ncbi:MAG TPA: chemotaxis protein CheA [Gemmatimonadaceae bacterium]|nr:chemotaxis protein CheA [Gemmatimonadaceae bacterium]